MKDELYYGNTYKEFEKNMDNIEVPEDFDPLEAIEWLVTYVNTAQETASTQ